MVESGVEKTFGPLVMEGNINPTTREEISNYKPGSETGEYIELSKSLARTLVAWDSTGQNFFMIMGQSTLNGAFGMGWSWQEAQTFAKDQLPAFIKQYTKPKSGRQGKEVNISGAMLLDGGTHSSIAYTRVTVEKELITDIPIGDNFNGWIAIMTGQMGGYTSVTEAYDEPGDPYYPTLKVNNHRENRTTVEAFVRK